MINEITTALIRINISAVNLSHDSTCAYVLNDGIRKEMYISDVRKEFAKLSDLMGLLEIAIGASNAPATGASLASDEQSTIGGEALVGEGK